MKAAYLFLLLLLIPIASAANDQYHMKLLAVSEVEGELKGDIADLYLEFNDPGKGRVFIETFPLTKFDTQISTRFAKEVACEFIDNDCNDIDFIYTIKAGSSIVGGPSAGAAIAVLTAASLKETDINEDVTITGTINSGGIIGPVGGIKQKIEAAASDGISKVLIPKGESITKQEISLNESINCTLAEDGIACDKSAFNDTNQTIDLVEYGHGLGIEIIEVRTLDDAFFYFTGERLRENGKEIVIIQDYTDVMKNLAELLCNRTITIAQQIDFDAFNALNQSDSLQIKRETAINFSKKGSDAFSKEYYYSSASFCFGANVKFGEILLAQINLSKDDTNNQLDDLRGIIKEFNEKIDNKEIMTISDLEAFMVVKERLIEAEDLVKEAKEKNDNNDTVTPILALAIERLYSADAWSKFFGLKGKEFILHKEDLKNGCSQKIAEVEERLQYISLFFPLPDENRKQLDRAYKDRDNGDFELCLFKASKAKAEIDSILNLIGINEDEEITSLISDKLDIIQDKIVRETSENIFPILGYSYYEYANSLKDSDMQSSLLYLEYALELSDLDIYFKEKESANLNFSADIRIIILIISGIIIGILIGLIMFNRKNREIIIRIE
ncbi:MAG: S16 family serine protease [Candidatus Woesearchaeota archaeon]